MKPGEQRWNRTVWHSRWLLEAYRVPLHHLLDRFGVLLREPAPRRMLVQHEQIPIAILASQQRHGVMRESIVECRKPFPSTVPIEILDHMLFPAKTAEELAVCDVPVPMQPHSFLPSGQSFHILLVIWFDIW